MKMKKARLCDRKYFKNQRKVRIKIKPKLRIEDDGRRDKGAGKGNTKLGKVEEDLEDFSKYISSNLEGFSLRRIDELQEIIVVRQDVILLKIKSKEESMQVD